MVKDKINYRALGPRTALTKQPVSGRANDGGLRIGEMERDAVISHGMSDFLRESMMERGDKYYMAVCNQTGMMAVYNPAKNLFMSPMADGPIKYTGSFDGKDMQIENITKFGRNFSVVCVPYSLKLLIQELQTANIQMRLITEDNIQQLENMAFSKNIDKLMAITDVKPKNIVDSIKKKLSGKKGDVFTTPINEPSPSPEYPSDASPAYQPSSVGTISPTDSPEYQPFSRNTPPGEFEPHSPTSPPPGGFEPHSPTSPPPNEMTGGDSESLDILSEQARQYNIGDSVHYRGDVLPIRIWKVTYVGDRFLKIETPMIHDMAGLDTTLMVTALDIYKPTDVMNTFNEISHQRGGGDENELYPMHFQESSNMPSTIVGGSGGVPAINFSPVFKIMNGGNDFSTGEQPIGSSSASENLLGSSVSQSGGSVDLPFINQIPTSIGSSGIDSNAGGSKKDDAKPSKIDFSKLIIKKV